MGQVPRLQATAFDDPLESARTQPWVFAAVGLAVLAVVVALYAALRPATSSDAMTATPMVSNAGLERDAGVGERLAEGLGPSSAQPIVAGSEAASDLGSAGGSVGLADAPRQGAAIGRSAIAEAPAAPAPNSDSASPLRLSDPDGLSVEPQVLVVPAPARPGERLPRGADELRRAVLGPDASPSIERRQPTRVSGPPERDYTPVPPELIAEIEDFKRTYQTGSSSASAASEQGALQGRGGAKTEPTKPGTNSAAQSVQAGSSSSRPAPLSSSVRRQLPPFLMTVHVYDEDPVRRFVYLNGSKVREGELTRDGFFLEQVLADGAIVRYDDHRFFESP